MQYIVLWISLFTMLALFIFLFSADFKIPQQTIVQKIEIKNKINICLPEDSQILKN